MNAALHIPDHATKPTNLLATCIIIGVKLADGRSVL